MSPTSILVIDDDVAFNRVLSRALSTRGYAVSSAHSVAEAASLAQEKQPLLAVLDLNIAGASGLTLIPVLLTHNPQCRIVVLTGYSSIATAVEAIKLGAAHYLAKPADVDTILATLVTSSVKPALPTSEFVPPVEPLSVNRLEWEHIQRVLQEHQGNISSTARALNMHRRTLQRKLMKKPVQR